MKGQFTLHIPAEKMKFIIGRKIRFIESESGAKVNINKYNKQAVIFGDEKQRARAITLIKESLDKAFILPATGFTFLESDNLIDKFQFIKYEGNDVINSGDRNHYFVRLMKETKDKTDKQESSEVDDLADLLGQKLEISSPPSTGGFTIPEKLDYCLNEICSHLSNTDPTDLERKEIRLNLFFGRELFSNIEKQIFSVNEWIKFNRERGRNRTLFQQSAPQILEKMAILEKKFGFKEDKSKEIKDKGSITIYFDQDSRRRKIKLHWKAEENSWKITKYVRDINRIAILDILSGNEAPDCRFLLKTCYDLHISPKIANIINEIQSKNSFDLKDGMWFRIKDFGEKLDKVDIRQTISKKRFFNERFQISVVSIKQESKDGLSTQRTTSLKNLSWRSVENIDQKLSLHYDEQEISNTIRETVQFAREIVKVLS